MVYQPKPESWKDKFDRLLTYILSVKKVYLGFTLFGIFLIAVFGSWLYTNNSNKKTNKLPEDPGFSVISPSDLVNENPTADLLDATPSPLKTQPTKTPTPSNTPIPNKVFVNNVEISFDAITQNSGNGVDSSVTYTTRIKCLSPETEKLFKHASVNFFTGNQGSNQFPTQYVANAPVDGSGQSKVTFNQSPGNYIGAALIMGSDNAKVQSTVVKYTISKITQALPSLVMKASAKSPSGISNDKNVTYTLVITVPDALKDTLKNAQKTKIDFYSGPQSRRFPNKLEGSCNLVNGIATINLQQGFGNYRCSAVWTDSPWGKLTSNAVDYAVPKGATSVTPNTRQSYPKTISNPNSD